jgi:hypothetical protein
MFTADVVSSAGETSATAGPDFLLGRPNPFNGNVLIEWSQDGHESSELEIFDLLGRLVLRRSLSVGRFNWSPGEVAGSGLYLIRVTTLHSVQSTRLLYIK